MSSDSRAPGKPHGLRSTPIQLRGNVSEFASIHRLQPHGAERLRAVLSHGVGAEILGMLGIVHFAHWYLLDGERLLFCCCYDGDAGDYVEALEQNSDTLYEIWRHCIGCPDREPPDELVEFITSGQTQTLAFYGAYPSLRVAQIRKFADLQAKVVNFQKDLAKPTPDTDFGAAGVGPEND